MCHTFFFNLKVFAGGLLPANAPATITSGICASFEEVVQQASLAIRELDDRSAAIEVQISIAPGHPAGVSSGTGCGLQLPMVAEKKERLSAREMEVLELVMQGYTNVEIAAKLFISLETVKTHRKHLLSKTGARNTAALIGQFPHLGQ